MKKKTILFFLIFLSVTIFTLKNPLTNFLKDYLSQEKKDFIVNNFLIFKKIERLEREIYNQNKQLEIKQTIIEDQKVKIKNKKKTNDHIVKLKGGFNFYNFSQEKINLDNRKYELKTIRTNNINVAKHSEATSTFYIEPNEDFLYLVSADGKFYYSNKNELFGNKNEIFFQSIKTNFHNNIVDYNKIFDSDNQKGIKDLHISKGKLFVSYINQVKENCYSLEVAKANLNLKELNFKKLYITNFCQSRPDQSGGRIQRFNDNNIILSIGEFGFDTEKLNLVDIDAGKIIIINTSNGEDYSVVGMGLRNPQGLNYLSDQFQNEIFITSHGPYGGDEINVINLNKNIKENNFGWPNVSYGEHYNCQTMTERCKNLYLQKPLKKGHSKYGFKEPALYFVPSIAISQIRHFYDNKFLLASMGNNVDEGDMSLHLLEYNKNRFLKIDKLILNERLRDIIVWNKSVLAVGETLGSIYILSILE